MPRRKLKGGNNLAPMTVITQRDPPAAQIMRNNVGLRNIRELHKLQTTKAPQAPGFLAQPADYLSQPRMIPLNPIIGGKRRRRKRFFGRMIGRPITDRYGAYVYVPNLVNT